MGANLTFSILHVIREMDGVENKSLQNRQELTAGARRQLFSVLGLGFVVAVIAGSSMLAFFSRRLSPLLSAALLAERIGGGELLQSPLDVKYSDEVGQVSRSLNQMLAQLQKESAGTWKNAETLDTATSQLATFTAAQSAADFQQLAAILQISATTDELAESAQQIADSARSVAQRAEDAAQASQEGLQSVRRSTASTLETVRQMETAAEGIWKLREQADAIESLVLTVGDLTERSHVLALSAAILAAGYDGDDFNLVVHEMKTLASQCKNSTLQISELVRDITGGIVVTADLAKDACLLARAGTLYSDEASVAIHQLSAQVQEASRAFSLIVAATTDQKLALAQINEALASIREASGSNAQATSDLQTASHNLQTLSGRLVQTLARPGQR